MAELLNHFRSVKQFQDRLNLAYFDFSKAMWQPGFDTCERRPVWRVKVRIVDNIQTRKSSTAPKYASEKNASHPFIVDDFFSVKGTQNNRTFFVNGDLFLLWR